jgi:hypothetical protein
MKTEYKNGESLFYFPPGSKFTMRCWYVKPDEKNTDLHIVLMLGTDELTTYSVSEHDLARVDTPVLLSTATCTNCNQEFMRKSKNDSWICDACFYSVLGVKCTVCGGDTNDFYSPKSGVVCHDCMEERS